MYTEWDVYGPYTREDGRQHLILYNGTDRVTLSYPRYLMELHLGRYLKTDEEVHHKDENVTNNNLGNLEIRNGTEHRQHHSTIYTGNIMVVCKCCTAEFELTAKQQSTRYRNRNRVKTGPFCSRQCSGIGETF